MNRAEIEEKIKASGGSWKSANGITYSIGDNGCLNVGRGVQYAFLLKGHDDLGNFYVGSNINIKDINEHYGFVADLCKDIGYQMPALGSTVGTPTTSAPAPSSNAIEIAELRGAIKVYERILPSGRKVQIEQ